MFNSFDSFGEVTVAAFEGVSPVIIINDDGTVTVFYPELLKDIFKGKEEIRYITGLTFHEAYEKVMNNEIDLLPAVIKTEERERYFNFNKEPLLVSWSEIFVHTDIVIENIFELKDKRIALMNNGQNGKNIISLMNSFDIPFEPVYFNNFTEMINSVYKKDVVALVSLSTFKPVKGLKSIYIVLIRHRHILLQD